MVKGNFSFICNIYICKQMEYIHISLTLIKIKRIARHLLNEMLIFSICW